MRNQMNLPDDNERNGFSPQVSAAMVMTACVTLLIIVIVLIANRKTSHHNTNTQPSGTGTSPVVLQETNPADTLTPGDLDFWSMYPADDGAGENADSGSSSVSDSVPDVKPADDGLPSEATDGRHTLVINRDGKEEWVTITPYLPRNDYDNTALVLQSGRMAYYAGGKVVSYLGMCVDKYDDYVDFNAAANDGIDFVMLRVGARGYGTGTITLDEYYADNLSRATQAGLDIGLYFTSQAVNATEAAEEAVALVAAIADYKITYPLVMDIGFVANDTSRIEKLTKTEKTAVIRTFADAIKAAGYTPAIHADKEFLIKEIDLSKFSDVDIWLDNPGDLPDYPYAFTMWEYTNNASVDGVRGYSDLTISFIDYTQK